MLSKLLSEAVEAIEPGPVEAFAPPVPTSWKRSFTAYYRSHAAADFLLSLSLRIQRPLGTVVGMVGAGGIGVTLWEAIRVSSSSKPAP